MGKNNHNKGGNPPRKHVNNPNLMANAQSAGREGMRLIKNMAYGKFNMQTEGELFRNPNFIKATIAELDKRLVDVNIHVTAMTHAYRGCDDTRVTNLLNRDLRTQEAYMLIRQTLQAIMISGDIGLLLALISRLPNYKYSL